MKYPQIAGEKMSPRSNQFGAIQSRSIHWVASVAVIAAGFSATLTATAALTDISQTPVASSSTAIVKPNIMLLMDASTSMGWTHMPDDIEGTSAAFPIGYRNFQCNALYYNPSKQYRLPKGPDSATLPIPSFTSARYNYYSTDTTTVDLSAAFRAFDTSTRRIQGSATGINDAAQAAYYYLYTGTQNLSYKGAPCTDADNMPINQPGTVAATGGGTWTRKIVSSTSGLAGSDERQNFAIWYTYYRTRLALTKSGIALAFSPISDRYRVGFLTMSPTDSAGTVDSPVNASKFLAVNDFDTTQRTSWFNKLFSQTASGSSPAREGLARVGRYYAGKTDHINKNMGADPTQYSCQQNFTIMTTDGYWNAAAEGNGPVGLDGVSAVGQQDGTLTDNSGLTPRPIWDGGIGGSRIITDQANTYAYAACNTGWFSQSTSQILVSTSQVLQSTTQLTQSTSQTTYSTSQITIATSQIQQSTSQLRQSTVQNLSATNQTSVSTAVNKIATSQLTVATSQIRETDSQTYRSTSQLQQTVSQNTSTSSQLIQNTSQINTSTSQLRKATSQLTQSTSQLRISTSQTTKSTSQPVANTSQLQKNTSQLTQSTSQTQIATSQLKKSTSQILQSTSQLTVSTSQTKQATSQLTKSTSQLTKSTTQLRLSTSQTFSYNAGTEQSTPVATCTSGGNISCSTMTTGPTPVATCTNDPPTNANGYTTTSCASATTGPTGVASCTTAAADSTNSYTSTACNTVTSGPTGVSACAASGAGSGNNYVATTCNTLTTPSTPVASCTPSSATSTNNYTTTTCVTTPTGPTGVATCAASGADSTNSYTATTCSTLTTGPTGVASCANSGANSTNSYIATSCNTQNLGPTPTDTCVNAGPSSTNAYLTTTCATTTTGPTFVLQSSCVAAAASSSNSYTATTCTPVTSGPTGVASCASPPPASTNNYTTTTCNTVTSSTGVQTCSPSGASSTNNYTTTTCPTVPGSTFVQTCTPAAASASNSWTQTTCTSNNTGPTYVSSCAAVVGVAPSWVTTSCNTTTTGPTGTDTCAAIAPTSTNDYKTTSCATGTTGPTGVASCTATPASSTNSYVATTCNTVTSGPAGAASCTAAAAGSGNSYIATTCNTVTGGPTPSASCAASGATATNLYVVTSCNTVTTSTTGVATCAASAASSTNNYTTTTCTGTNNPATGVPACVPQSPTPANNNTTITCGNSTVVTGVATCVASLPTSANSYKTTTCATVTTGPTLVATCTGSGPTAANQYLTTTCNTPATSSYPVASCTPTSGPPTGPNFVTVTCNTVTTPATGTQTCTGAAPSAGNLYTTTTCNTVTTPPTAILTCTPSSASSSNSWTDTTCSQVTTGPTFVASCTPTVGNPAGPGYVLTTCNTVNTAATPVASCTNIAPNAGNNFKTTTCTTATSGPTGVATCTPALGDSTNSYVTTSCVTGTTGPTGVASCTTAAAGSGNSYVATTCNTVNTSNFTDTCTASGPTATNGYKTTTCTTDSHGPTATPSCTAINPVAGNNYLRTTCNTVVSTPVGVASCTSIAANSGNSYTATNCVTATSGPTGVASCTASSPSSINGYVNTTCQTINTPATPTAFCTSAAGNSGNAYLTTTCNTINGAPATVQNCTPSGASSANTYVATTCTALPGKKLQYTNTTTTTTYLRSGDFTIGTPVSTVIDPKSPADLNSGMCYVDPAPNPQPNPALAALPPLPSTTPTVPTRPTASLPPQLPATCTSWPCTTDTAGASTGSSNSLADVAQYYYVTDLRPTLNDDVVARGTGPEDDRATWQHMTTFGVGLGVSGTLNYSPTYKSDTSGDFSDIRSGVKNWPAWPDPALDYNANGLLYNDAKSIDDFWHASVNGRGQYFSANDPDSVVKGISDALTGIRSLSGSGAPVTPTSSNPTAGDNTVFIGTFTSEKWYGDLAAYSIDLTTAAVSKTALWSAQQRLSTITAPACDSRNIYIFRNGNANNLAEFTWNSQTCNSAKQPDGAPRTDLTSAEQDLFSLTKAQTLTQYLDMTDGTAGTVDQRSQIAGSKLVNFIRGYRGNENFVSNDATKLYRGRDFVLGDIVGSQAAYVKEPSQSYQDSGYDVFKQANRNRTPMVYVGGNDGMLHAFKAPKDNTDATAGMEQWSYIPTPVLPKLYKLADTEYAALHTFMVDGSPTSGDVYDTGSSSWRTIVVTGLGAGGKGYFAMDVTDPATPKALWEFNYTDTCYDGTSTTTKGDCHVGLSFGKPIITKLQGSPGRWVAMFTSGYNNVSTPAKTGDGVGYLYVVDAMTGSLIYKISTGVGTSDNPSGLNQINNYVGAVSADNTTQRVYGGDQLGNVWRFDVNDIYDPAGREASLVAVAKDPAGTVQPITTRIELAEYNGNTILLVGTGQLLGASDVPISQTQSVYGFIDSLSSSVIYSNLRTSLKPMVMSTVTDSTGSYRTLTCAASTTAACSVLGAWYFDLPISGERVDVAMSTALRTLTFVSNAPNSSACTAGGESYFNQVDLLSGNPPGGINSPVSTKLESTLGVGLTLVQLPDGTVHAIGTLSSNKANDDGTNSNTVVKNVTTGTPDPMSKRVSWKEITQ